MSPIRWFWLDSNADSILIHTGPEAETYSTTSSTSRQTLNALPFSANGTRASQDNCDSEPYLPLICDRQKWSVPSLFVFGLNGTEERFGRQIRTLEFVSDLRSDNAKVRGGALLCAIYLPMVRPSAR